jgi:hypothetical protein
MLSAPSSTQAITTSTAPSVSAAQVDLDTLLTSLETIHPDPFHGIGRDEFVAELDRISLEIDHFRPEEAMVEVMALWASLSREGQDGHQLVLPLPGEEGPMLPIANQSVRIQ